MLNNKKQKNIPDGWREVRLGDMVNIYDGTHQTPQYVKKGIPFYSVEHISSNNFLDTKFISEDIYQQEIKKVKIEKDDILMTRIGDVGTAKYINWDVKASFYVTLALIKNKSKDLNMKFLASLINSREFRGEVWKKTIHVAFPNKINLGDISKCKAAFPPISEQKRIVGVLEAWDGYLEKLGKKIEIKKNIKKGLMQNLLTGKIRLKGFKEKWETVKFGDIGDIVTGNTPPMKDRSNYGEEYYWATAEDFNGKYIYNTRIKLSEQGKSLSRFLPKGSVLITCIASIGKNAVAGVPLSTNQQINSIVVNNKNDNEFIYYLIQNSIGILKRYAGSGAVMILNKIDFSKIKVSLPKLKEQQAIAKILTVADEEIENLEKKKKIIEEQKRYLLNNLITGKIRVPENSSLRAL
jgi:type I restriction enzyme S subunit